jgi:tetratricopeptide (TPR) repeat protein
MRQAILRPVTKTIPNALAMLPIAVVALSVLLDAPAFPAPPKQAAPPADPSQAKYLECAKLLEDHKNDPALACFSELTKASPRSGNAFYYVGLLQLEKAAYQPAAQAFETAVSLDGKDRDALRYLTESLYMLGQIDRAIETAARGDALYPSFLAFKTLLIRCYHRQADRANVEKTRGELFRLRNEKQIVDGLDSKILYLREIFPMGAAKVYGVEYFASQKKEGPKYSFRVKEPNREDLVYRLEYHPRLDKAAAELGEQKPGDVTYWLDAQTDSKHWTVATFRGDPGYFSIRDAVVADIPKHAAPR